MLSSFSFHPFIFHSFSSQFLFFYLLLPLFFSWLIQPLPHPNVLSFSHSFYLLIVTFLPPSFSSAHFPPSSRPIIFSLLPLSTSPHSISSFFYPAAPFTSLTYYFYPCSCFERTGLKYLAVLTSC